MYSDMDEILHPRPNTDDDIEPDLRIAWPRAASMLAGTPDLMLLGIEPMPRRSCAEMQAILHEVLRGNGLFFAEALASEQFIPLGSQMAAYVARHVPNGIRTGVLLPPISVADLYELALHVARRIQEQVVLHAPGWGLWHRIDPKSGAETGNAACFGLAMTVTTWDCP